MKNKIYLLGTALLSSPLLRCTALLEKYGKIKLCENAEKDLYLLGAALALRVGRMVGVGRRHDDGWMSKLEVVKFF
jgi:hypothetical protein